jgi:hypothetical protein
VTVHSRTVTAVDRHVWAYHFPSAVRRSVLEREQLTGTDDDRPLARPRLGSLRLPVGATTRGRYPSTYARCEQRNVATELAHSGSLLRHYIRLIRLRSAYEALRTGSLIAVQTGNVHVYAYVRHGEAEDVLVVHNLGAEPASEYAPSVRGSALAPGRYRV